LHFPAIEVKSLLKQLLLDAQADEDSGCDLGIITPRVIGKSSNSMFVLVGNPRWARNPTPSWLNGGFFHE
jgi:hypothetical protein